MHHELQNRSLQTVKIVFPGRMYFWYYVHEYRRLNASFYLLGSINFLLKPWYHLYWTLCGLTNPCSDQTVVVSTTKGNSKFFKAMELAANWSWHYNKMNTNIRNYVVKFARISLKSFDWKLWKWKSKKFMLNFMSTFLTIAFDLS